MLTIEQLKEAGAIYLEHIQEGFEYYNYKVVSWNQEETCEHIRKLWLLNGPEHSFADFYYYRLDNEAKKKVNSILNEEEINYIKAISFSWEEIIFPLDEILINIIIKLNNTEMLFSTFYFTKEPCTLWGNYHGEYIVFQH
ncbi:hypothetical protein [Anaerocolumna sp.]|uniref:hypothetical protein n=1 Tax=Anaerocolumna sp. TaxID=2041569 RepID=UPI0028AD93D6|nr:hypothetical protein [Anaerocolumna sp.]